MANSSDVGISPVLLQAISQTLSTSTPAGVCQNLVSHALQTAVVPTGQSASSAAERVGNDVITSVKHVYLTSDGSISDDPASASKLSNSVGTGGDDHERHYVVCNEEETTSSSPNHMVSYSLSSDSLTNQNAFGSLNDGELIRQSYENTQPIVTTTSTGGKSVASIMDGYNQFESQNGETIVVVQNVEDIGQHDIKSEQHLQDAMGRHIIIKRVVANDADSTTEEVHLSHEGISMGTVLSAIASHLKMKAGQEEAEAAASDANSDAAGPQQIIVTFNGNEASVPSPGNNVTVADTETVSNIIPVRTADGTIDCMIGGKKVQLVEGLNTTPGGATIHVSSSSDNVEGMTVVNTADTGSSDLSIAIANVVSQTTTGEPCPICGDKISGYHYGIYTCESCKGFFKRTVQNRKSFVCHRKGDCEINIANRKKCPACRFKRCLHNGMKLAAIREDRSRGGRSSYDGCLPFTTRSPSSSTPTVKHRAPRHPSVSSSQNQQNKTPTRTMQTCSQLAAMLSTSAGNLHKVVRPQKPQILLDLMNVESLNKDEEAEQQCCEGKLADDDADMFGSLLHLADHCLYKIVRWARNLPDFTSLSTDDQILLLQNCWAELLCLSCCWASVHAQGEIRLSHNRVITMEKAKMMGISDIIQRMCDFVEHLRRMEVDHCEYVTLRVMTLMTPDVKGLKEEKTIRDYQEKLTDALHLYASTHYPHNETKLAEMLTRLPEVSRICIIAKEQLTARQAVGDIPQYSLLSELLKGDMLLQQSS